MLFAARERHDTLSFKRQEPDGRKDGSGEVEIAVAREVASGQSESQQQETDQKWGELPSYDPFSHLASQSGHLPLLSPLQSPPRHSDLASHLRPAAELPA